MSVGVAEPLPNPLAHLGWERRAGVRAVISEEGDAAAQEGELCAVATAPFADEPVDAHAEAREDRQRRVERLRTEAAHVVA